MSNQNNNQAMWPVFIALLILGCVFAGAFSGAKTTTTTQSYEPDTSSREYRYVKERVKLEGYSDKESAQAADAIMKFHNAQKARQR